MTDSREQLTAEALAEVQALMSFRRRAFCASFPQREVSLPQLFLLIALGEEGCLTISQLTHLLGISAPSVSSLVDRMEEHGLVERVRDRADRRVVHVQVTARGRETVEAMMGWRRAEMERLMAGMNEEELGDFRRGMAALRHALERLSDDAAVDREKEGAVNCAVRPREHSIGA